MGCAVPLPTPASGDALSLSLRSLARLRSILNAALFWRRENGDGAGPRAGAASAGALWGPALTRALPLVPDAPTQPPRAVAHEATEAVCPPPAAQPPGRPSPSPPWPRRAQFAAGEYAACVDLMTQVAAAARAPAVAHNLALAEFCAAGAGAPGAAGAAALVAALAPLQVPVRPRACRGGVVCVELMEWTGLCECAAWPRRGVQPCRCSL